MPKEQWLGLLTERSQFQENPGGGSEANGMRAGENDAADAAPRAGGRGTDPEVCPTGFAERSQSGEDGDFPNEADLGR